MNISIIKNVALDLLPEFVLDRLGPNHRLISQSRIEQIVSGLDTSILYRDAVNVVIAKAYEDLARNARSGYCLKDPKTKFYPEESKLNFYAKAAEHYLLAGESANAGSNMVDAMDASGYEDTRYKRMAYYKHVGESEYLEREKMAFIKTLPMNAAAAFCIPEKEKPCPWG